MYKILYLSMKFSHSNVQFLISLKKYAERALSNQQSCGILPVDNMGFHPGVPRSPAPRTFFIPRNPGVLFNQTPEFRG